MVCILVKKRIQNVGGGFKDFLFSSLPGEMIQFHKYFSNGLKPPTRNYRIFFIHLPFFVNIDFHRFLRH